MCCGGSDIGDGSNVCGEASAVLKQVVEDQQLVKVELVLWKKKEELEQ